MTEKLKRNEKSRSRWLSMRGETDRRVYLIAGVTLFLLKYAIDYTVASLVLGKPWSILHYLSSQQILLLRSGTPGDRLYFTVMFLVSLPFIWIGITLTVRRLRSAAMPIWLAFLFFLPTINVFFLMIIAVMPPRERKSTTDSGAHQRVQPSIHRRWPRNPATSAVLSMILTIIAGFALTGLSVYGLGVYGFGLFVGVPFCMGLIATIIYGFCGSQNGAAYRMISVLVVFGLLVFLLLAGAEGFGCLLMAAPIWLVCGLLGGLVGEAIQSYAVNQREIAILTIMIVLAVPALMGAECLLQPPRQTYTVATSTVIDASPERVWRNVVSFPELPPPTEWTFRMGIAYPIGASIEGSGVSAIRRCEFNTGTFVEPIEVWDPPRLLKFAVTENPPSMHELTFYDGVHPPHLEGYLVSRAGQFQLTPLPDGATLLEGTTWYENDMRPAMYWRLWSDRAIATIHRRVLRHIKQQSEASPQFVNQNATLSVEVQP